MDPTGIAGDLEREEMGLVRAAVEGQRSGNDNSKITEER